MGSVITMACCTPAATRASRSTLGCSSSRSTSSMASAIVKRTVSRWRRGRLVVIGGNGPRRSWRWARGSSTMGCPAQLLEKPLFIETALGKHRGHPPMEPLTFCMAEVARGEHDDRQVLERWIANHGIDYV